MTNPQTTVMIPPPFLRFPTGAAIIGMYLVVSGTVAGPTSEVVETWILDPLTLTWLVDPGRDDQVAILSVPGFRSALGEIPTSSSCSVTGIGATMMTRNTMAVIRTIPWTLVWNPYQPPALETQSLHMLALAAFCGR